MIVGIGTDLANIDRIQGVLSRHGDRFKNRVFTKTEQAKASRRKDEAGTYAKRWAAKEACSKALCTGLRMGKLNIKKIILDPVMVAKGGQRLVNKKSIKLMKNNLLKKVTLVTPNIPEAEVLSGISIKTVEDMVYAAKIINILGVKNVLIKGGHLSTKKIHDVLLSNNKVEIFNSKKIITKNTHGTGCTLSSAIATFYSCGKTLKKSCELGINYVNRAIMSGPNYGKGHGPINHINNIEIKKII